MSRLITASWLDPERVEWARRVVAAHQSRSAEPSSYRRNADGTVTLSVADYDQLVADAPDAAPTWLVPAQGDLTHSEPQPLAVPAASATLFGPFDEGPKAA